MKTLLKTLLFFLLVTQMCFPQWFWQNPLPQGNTLNDITFIDEYKEIAVGGSGTIIQTTDGGKNWTIQPSGVTLTFNNVFFSDSNNGWVVGDNGTILHTTNFGLDWMTQSSGTSMPLNGVYFTDNNNGWVVGGYYNGNNNDGIILRTTDGGENWNIQFIDTGPDYYLFNAVYFIDTNVGVVVGMNGRIFRTTDGAKNWNNIQVCAGPILGVSFADANTGIAVGSYWNGSYNEVIILRNSDWFVC